MDDRVRRHAETLVDWSARIEAGDDVIVSLDEGTHELGVAVARLLGERGANPVFLRQSGELTRAYLHGYADFDGEFESDPAHELALCESADAYLSIRGGHNTTAMADVPGETRQAHAKATQAIRQARLATDWVSTIHPTRSLAQQAGMAYEEYQDFVYDAVLRDWESLAAEMAQMKEILDDGEEVRIVRENTDITMSIAGRTAVNSAASVAYDSHNLPSGEVFTAPVADSVEGEVHFDVPMTINDTRVRDVHLTFEAGEVVEFAAAAGEEVLADLLETDTGACRLGELGIGMNRSIDRFTDNILFDEKMGDTVHLALGRAYDACLPEGESGNDSAIHTDMITDVSGDSRLEVDGEVVQRNGTFRWEDGFTA
jgi:aminopeptidase